jgi:hypothetical protein
MYEPGSWLEPIKNLGNAAINTYFENMSRAMAQQCLGDVYVMSDQPANLTAYQKIWGTVEWPTLAGRYKGSEGTSLCPDVEKINEY